MRDTWDILIYQADKRHLTVIMNIKKHKEKMEKLFEEALNKVNKRNLVKIF